MAQYTIGQRIKHCREQKHMKLEDLSYASRVREGDLRAYENRGRTPSAMTLAKIAAALCVSTDFLICGSNSTH